MIEALEVTVLAGGARLVDRVSLRAEPGEIVAIVGPNGAGKSTLLRALAGDLRPHAGAVRLGGKPIATLHPRELARVRAVLPQDVAMTTPFPALEVVLLGRSPHVGQIESATDWAIARLAMAATDTLALADRIYPTLSGGERLRVQTARVLAQIWDAPAGAVLLLDEPTASLDPRHQHALLETARSMAARERAVVCVLHDLNLAAQYADRIAVLHRGRLVADGAPAAVLGPSLLEDVFELDARVVPHPELPCPLVVARGPARFTAGAVAREQGRLM